MMQDLAVKTTTEEEKVPLLCAVLCAMLCAVLCAMLCAVLCAMLCAMLCAALCCCAQKFIRETWMKQEVPKMDNSIVARLKNFNLATKVFLKALIVVLAVVVTGWCARVWIGLACYRGSNTVACKALSVVVTVCEGELVMLLFMSLCVAAIVGGVVAILSAF
jgi:hypothetical protein